MCLPVHCSTYALPFGSSSTERTASALVTITSCTTVGSQACPDSFVGPGLLKQVRLLLLTHWYMHQPKSHYTAELGPGQKTFKAGSTVFKNVSQKRRKSCRNVRQTAPAKPYAAVSDSGREETTEYHCSSNAQQTCPCEPGDSDQPRLTRSW